METFRGLFPPKAEFTEKDCPDQTGKVFLITGASSGVGAALAKILYAKHAKIYIAARAEAKARAAIESIQSAHPDSRGALVFLSLDLADLATVRRSAETFLAAERRLDVLWLNAGVMAPPAGSTTAQGYELQLGTNNLGHFLFAQCLLPALRAAAAAAQQAGSGAPRVVWVSSSAVNLAPSPPVDMENVDYRKKIENPWTLYARSKCGNVLHALEFARRYKDEGILSVSLNPGNLKSDLQRHMGRLARAFVYAFIVHDAKFGAYTELFAGLSPSITPEQNGAWSKPTRGARAGRLTLSAVQPWGRIVQGRKDLNDVELGAKYWDWSAEQVKAY